MKTIAATVIAGNRLELSEPLGFPPGAHIRVLVEPMGDEDDYAARLGAYYRLASKEVLSEERALAEQLIVADAELGDEEPWW